MKKGLKITLGITGSIAGALILTIIILWSITVRPLSPFTGVDYNINVAASSINTTQNQEYEGEIKSELDSVRFSVMRSILEGSTDYGIKAEYTTVDDEEVKDTISAANFLNITPGVNQFMLRFTFGKTQTNKNFSDDDGKLIKFDSLIMIINKSSGNIQPVLLYPYLSGNLDNDLVDTSEDGDGAPLDTADENGNINSDYYKVYKFTAKMYTSSLYDFLIDKGYTTGSAAL